MRHCTEARGKASNTVDMSLVQLSNVCSHLQNASLARLGLTSIPYTKLHLSLSLLLLKEGFVSQVKVAGLSPPASCFPPGLRDNNRITAFPHTDRDILSPESALQRMVRDAWNEQRLEDEGFQQETIEFAVEHRLKNKVQLERDGWDDVAVDFCLEMWRRTFQLDDEGKADVFSEHFSWTRDDLLANGVSEQDAEIVLRYQPLIAESWDEVLQWHRTEDADQTQLVGRLRKEIKRRGFDVDTLRYFAGPDRFRSERELQAEGIDLEVMGLTVPNQTFNPPDPQYADPWQLETEGVVTQANRASRRLWLGLKYFDGIPVLRKARMISKPTKRFYLTAHELSYLCRGRSAGEVKPMSQIGEVLAVTTDRGVLDAKECVQRRMGGMALCRIW